MGRWIQCASLIAVLAGFTGCGTPPITPIPPTIPVVATFELAAVPPTNGSTAPMGETQTPVSPTPEIPVVEATPETSSSTPISSSATPQIMLTETAAASAIIPTAETTEGVVLSPAASHVLIMVENLESNAGNTLAWFDVTTRTLTDIRTLLPGERAARCGEPFAGIERAPILWGEADEGFLSFAEPTWSAENPGIIYEGVTRLTCIEGIALTENLYTYIDFPDGATRAEYPVGTLTIRQTDGVLRTTVERVAAFSPVPNGTSGNILFIALYTNAQDEADEAGISLYDTVGESVREVAVLRPSEADCRFTSAALAARPDAGAVIVMGQRCTRGDTRTRWQLYTLDSNGSVALAGSDFQPGTFAPYTDTNRVWLSSDGETAFFTVPDGITAYTAAIAAFDLTTLTPRVIVERQAVFANYNGTEDAPPHISPDGRWLAFVITSPDGERTLSLIDLTQPNAAPIRIPTGSEGDVIRSLAFTRGSEMLYYSAGDSVFALDLGAGIERRIARGIFDYLTVMPDGVGLIAMQRQTRRDEPFGDLVMIAPDTGTVTLLAAGALIEGERAEQRRDLVPLWMP